MGWYDRYLGIESILVKYCDEILQLSLRLPTHIMEGRVKILETYPKSEEIISFYPIFSSICIYKRCVEQNCHVLVTTLYTSISLVSTHINEGKLKILDRNKKYEDIICFYLKFCAFMSFYCDVVEEMSMFVWDVLKSLSPEFGTVLHWRPPDVHIFPTDPSLVKICQIFFLKMPGNKRSTQK